MILGQEKPQALWSDFAQVGGGFFLSGASGFQLPSSGGGESCRRTDHNNAEAEGASAGISTSAKQRLPLPPSRLHSTYYTLGF